MLNYEIRYLRGDHKVALIYRTQQWDDREAMLAASDAVRIRYKQFEVWRGDDCVGRGINPSLPN
ncbi:MAG: hypothetical protein JOZ55_03615 [Alphaproteobacteria bacterium]|nr:hypothetical protein [Alphaproteobacteria bacterium]